jgi:hypothetical protein
MRIPANLVMDTFEAIRTRRTGLRILIFFGKNGVHFGTGGRKVPYTNMLNSDPVGGGVRA